MKHKTKKQPKFKKVFFWVLNEETGRYEPECYLSVEK